MKHQAAEATIAAVAQKVSAGGGGLSLFGLLTASEVAAFGGLGVAVAGLIVQAYYKRKDDRRKDELHRLRVQQRLLRPYEDDDSDV